MKNENLILDIMLMMRGDAEVPLASTTLLDCTFRVHPNDEECKFKVISDI
jgi:hypothetical protein